MECSFTSFLTSAVFQFRHACLQIQNYCLQTKNSMRCLSFSVSAYSLSEMFSNSNNLLADILFFTFSQQNEISLWNCTMFLLSILQLLGIYEVSISWLLWIQQQWLCISKHLGNRIFPLSVLSTSSLRSQSILISIFWGNSTLIYPRVAPPVWIHSSAECPLLPHPW